LLKNAENLTLDQDKKSDRGFLLSPDLKLIDDYKEKFHAVFNRELAQKRGEVELKK